MKTPLNDLCYGHNLIPDHCTIFRSDGVYTNDTRGGALIAFTTKLTSSTGRYNWIFLNLLHTIMSPIMFNYSLTWFKKSESTVANLVHFLHFIILVCSKCEADAIYYDLSTAINLVPHSLLLHKSLCFLWDVSQPVSWLLNQQFRVCVSSILTIWPSEVISGVLQGSVLGPLLFSVFITDLCNFITVNISSLPKS
jgi:hypothetical protein